jgi:ketosteroid isomerase-like protein
MIPRIVLLLVLAAATPAAQQTSPTAAEQAVREAEAARIKALMTNDLVTLGPLLADDLTYTHSNGKMDGKAQFLASLESGQTRYQAFAPRDLQVRVYGPTAVLNGEAAVGVTVGGEARLLDLRFTSVWVQKGGRWQFAAWQSTRIAP